MKKQKLAVVFAALLTMVGFSSCLNSEDDGIREWGGYFEVNNTYGSVNFVDPTGIQLVPNKTIIDAPASSALAYINYQYKDDDKLNLYVYDQFGNIEKGSDRLQSNVKAQINNIKGINFIASDYQSLKIPNNSIIYCDIPYKDTKQYLTSKDFNHIEFWEWCRNKTKEGNDVFISEYNAPEDFECVWKMEVTNSMNTTKTYKPTEKLFKYKI